MEPQSTRKSEEAEQLERLLDSQREAGEVVSSSGFTIDSLKARQKLGEYQLPAPGLWLVKLVQAAVALEVPQVQIRFGRQEVQLEFETAHPLSAEDLLDQVMSGVIPTDRVGFHLVTGLRASATEATETVEWSTIGPDSVSGIRLSGDGVELFEPPNEGSETTRFSFQATRPRRWWLGKSSWAMPVRQLLKSTADEFSAVANHCWYCPTEVVLDGRKLPKVHRVCPVPNEESWQDVGEQIWANGYAQGHKLVLARASLEAPEGRPLLADLWPRPSFVAREKIAVARGHACLYKPVYAGGTFLEWERETAPGGFFILFYGGETESRLEFLCDGAVVDSMPLPWRTRSLEAFGKRLPQNMFKVALRVMVAVEHSELDLSHFKVRDREALAQEWMERLQSCGLALVDLCMEHRKSFDFTMTWGPDSSFGPNGAKLARWLMKLHLPAHLIVAQTVKGELQNLRQSLLAED